MRASLYAVVFVSLFAGPWSCQARKTGEEAKKPAPPAQDPGRQTPDVPSGESLRGRDDPPYPDQVYKIPIAGAACRGPEFAKVTLVVALGYSHRGKQLLPVLDQLRKDYQNDLKIVYQHNTSAALDKYLQFEIAACAANRQGKFFEMDKLNWDMLAKIVSTTPKIKNRTYFNRGIKQLKPVVFENFAKKLDLDIERFRKDTDDFCPEQVLTSHVVFYGIGVREVPVFFVNGRYLKRAEILGDFKQLIDEELKKANARLSAGEVSLEKYYMRYVLEEGKGLPGVLQRAQQSRRKTP